jgi:hypothetical protein
VSAAGVGASVGIAAQGRHAGRGGSMNSHVGSGARVQLSAACS